ncbi:hypothetical protein [Nocardia sp. CNY236]|uniref:hypothetical protein n=1 Tax=Nocardia sp. CNY236 TaxID=1169152 RepID=UPI00041D4CA1|nr:hypothetical protein [Nocardia sp. CNY236]
MNTATKFAGFTLGLTAVFAIALGTGALLGPEPTESAAHDAAEHDEMGRLGGASLGTLASDRGYMLELDTPQIITSAADVPVRFRILDRDGAPVTRYVTTHDKDLHLIVVRRDMAAYQHVHPVLENDTWNTRLDLTRAGEYRMFADFTPDGDEDLTLGADLRVAGDYDPRPLLPATSTSTVGDYSVTLQGTVTPGQPSQVTLIVNRAGAPVTDLQPYLAAYGHLVALRTTDLGYLHVHPNGHPGDGVTPAGPDITFTLTAPSAGDYRLFLDFQHQDVVRTAEFTLPVARPPAADISPATEHTGTDGHGH